MSRNPSGASSQNSDANAMTGLWGTTLVVRPPMEQERQHSLSWVGSQSVLLGSEQLLAEFEQLLAEFEQLLLALEQLLLALEQLLLALLQLLEQLLDDELQKSEPEALF